MKRIIKQLNAKKVALAKIRDDFREIEAEAGKLGDDADEAFYLIQQAIDKLSELV